MKRFVILLPLLAVLTACSSTKMYDVSSQKADVATMKKILVLGVNTTPEIQKAMETAFSKSLAGKDREVVLTSDWFPGDKQATREQIAARVKAEGVTGVLVTRLMNYEVTAVQENYPEFSLYSPTRTPGTRVGWEQDPWVAGFENAQQIRENAPLVERKAVVETRLYDAATGQVVWEAHSKTQLDRDAKRNFDGFISTIIVQLKKNGWL
jgi:hypothetical protein